MRNLANQMLHQLMHGAERLTAGVRSRTPALTTHDLAPYRQTAALKDKESFEAVIKACRANGAVVIHWDYDDGNAIDNFIKRVEVINVDALANFLGETPHHKIMETARSTLLPHAGTHAVLLQVLEQWSKMKLVRRTSAKDLGDWIDAIKVISETRQYNAKGHTRTPIRQASYAVFKNTKRMEKLAGPVDVLSLGDLDAAARPTMEVWQELGIYREEQPMRLAGHVHIRRTRVEGLIDSPYAAFPADAVLAITSRIETILTIENLTTFHTEAERLCNEPVLLIYTGGTPSPAWRTAYARLIESSSPALPVCHWGDVDEGGFRIAALLQADLAKFGRTLLPWRMHPKDIPEELRISASQALALRMAKYARQAGWDELATELEAAKMTVEQEGL
ncbi:Wadjet anti-phage system protein JetD domain-containing protein [Undibacterium sp. Tian12W]|uniref:Wadjet anti-phage system protein JetD domain-containing protein n=1 Tax=Undibacterium sp. Tian12W TaxID=3413054 RepID=UPI003BF204AA